MRKNEINLSGLIAPSFHGVHRDIKKHKYTHYSLYGGRGSAKSSFVSVEALLLIKRNPELHAAVFRKVASTLRDSVYAQYIWAVAALGLENEFACSVSPMQIVYKPTGQRILFRGSDDWSKIKSLKVPFGYIGVTHFEELDQFDSRAEIRSILQSTMRGGEHFWNFETFNPPRSQSNWVNKDILETRNDRLAHKSDYLGVPQEWLGRQFLEEAELLKKTNETAYRHEYLGEVTGTGGSVFRNVAAREISAQEISAFDRIYMGVDWGYYPDPFAWNKMHYDANRRVLYIFDELTLFRASNRDSERALREKDVKDYELITADSSEPKSVADYKSFGLSCRAAVKGAGSVEYSMKWLAGLDAVIIDPVRCRDTLKEFLEYEFDRGRNDEVINAYPDRENHHIDAVRYAMERVWKRRGL